MLGQIVQYIAYGGEGKLLCCIFGYVCGFEDTVEGVVAVMGRALLRSVLLMRLPALS